MAPEKKTPASKAAEKKHKLAENDEANAPIETAPAPHRAQPALPPMYAAIEALSATRHGALKLAASQGYGHAAKMSSIILAASEIPAAAQDFPVVFSDQGDNAMPYAVTGHAEGVNLHVDADGAWRKDAYIPAYVRRYPFIFIKSDGGKRLLLGVDPGASALSQTEGAPLYKADGKPSATARNAVAFCKAYKSELDRTGVLVRQIMDTGITVARRANVTLPGGGKAAVAGFRIVDEKKLGALPDETFLALRKSGALTIIYCHLMSMGSWRNLLA